MQNVLVETELLKKYTSTSRILTTGSKKDMKVISCLCKISEDALNTLFKGRGVSSDLAARKRAAVEINCKRRQISKNWTKAHTYSRR